MTKDYLLKKGDREIGPFPLADVRRMVRSGTLGRFQSVSADGGLTWAAASTFAEIWQSTDLMPLPPRATPPEVTSLGGAAEPPPQIVVPPGVDSDPAVVPPAPHEQPRARARSGFGLALAGFITTTAAISLALPPFFIWLFRYEAGYAAVPLCFLFLAASITGLVLSATAMGRRAGGFATAGFILGICGATLGVVTAIGWIVSHDPREDWIRRLTATAEADLQLARRDFGGSMRRYRDHAPNDDHAASLERLTKDLMMLTEAHKRLLIAAASTPRFRKYFVRLDDLRTEYRSFSEAVKLQDNITSQEAIDRIGRSGVTLKELLDLQDLYRTGQLSLDAAQAKFRGS